MGGGGIFSKTFYTYAYIFGESRAPGKGRKNTNAMANHCG
jgi:hypothetical protein